MTRWTQMRRILTAGSLVAVGLLLAGPAGFARADEIPDPAGDILPTYTGVPLPGMDVVAHQVTFAGDRLVVFGRMAGPVAPTPAIGGLYLFGIDRGRGTARFLGPAAPPVIGPHVLWDLIVRINPDGTGLVNNVVAGVITPLDPADIHIDGDEFTASVPLALLLPAATRPPLEWTYNLWPRNGIGHNVQVSDLAPDDGNAPVQAVPEPTFPTPFKGELGGDVAMTPAPPLVLVDVEATGNATQLGRFALDVPHVVYPESRLAAGSYEFTAANGDTLSAAFAGQATLSEIPGVLSIVESAVIEGGTGRFAGASGSFTVKRWYDTLTGTTVGSFEGMISSVGARKR